MSHPHYTQLPIPDAFLIEYRAFSDNRGYLAELYNSDKYRQAQHENVQQITLSHSKKYVLRGIHKVPYSKLITCVKGGIYDVIVDLRPDSPTYLMWVGILLKPDNHRQLYVPANCGHAFVSLDNESIVIYGQSEPFNPSLEDNCRFDDPFINVFWSGLENKILEISQKDKDTPPLAPSKIPAGVSPKRDRVLIVGASGQLGNMLTHLLRNSYQSEYSVYGTFCTHSLESHCVKFDLSTAYEQGFECKTLLRMCYPKYVIICAAMTWVDGCEKSQKEAYNINCNSVFNLALEARNFGAKIIYISTDYVFGGITPKVGTSFSEEDVPSPINVYGSTKRVGEQLVLGMDRNNLVIRTSSLFGPDKMYKNFPCQVMRNLKGNVKLSAFGHVVSTPTYTADLSICIIQLMASNCRGILHLSGPESVSKYEWALKVAETFDLDNSLIERTDSFPALAAKRPLNSSLTSCRGGDVLSGFQFKRIDEALNDWKLNYPDYLGENLNSMKSKI